MNAAELVAAIRAEHYPVGQTEVRCWSHGDYGVPWPCSAAAAADRIEEAYVVSASYAVQHALDGR